MRSGGSGVESQLSAILQCEEQQANNSQATPTRRIERERCAACIRKRNIWSIH